MSRAGFHALLLLSLVSLGHDAFGRKIEGLLGQEHTRGQEKAAVETPSSAGREDVLSPQEPGPWAPQTQVPVPVTSHSAPHVPVFMPEFTRAPDGLNGLYLPPPPPEPPTYLIKPSCNKMCEEMNSKGICEINGMCVLSRGR
ncbi:uncharacterized protein LOC134780160 isoform X2 [Penaeus indicus]|uniref:uncharacterized protein LOC134780160 isoform X2 n=1 Tax=Penaeus indicus TaxID=29960 RepID=UPI00300D255B